QRSGVSAAYRSGVDRDTSSRFVPTLIDIVTMNNQITLNGQQLMVQTIPASQTIQLQSNSNQSFPQLLMPSQQIILQQPQNGQQILQTSDGQAILCNSINAEGSANTLVQTPQGLIQLPANT